MGRTTIEGWLCGKSGWIYNIDEEGTIIDKKLHNIPTDIEKYKSSNITNQIKKEYESLI